jgi:tetrahydromethanopterin S-methyltransferase subunit G
MLLQVSLKFNAPACRRAEESRTMQYKGEDLDLRVPQARASRDYYPSAYEHAGNGRWSRGPSFGISNGEPLWVDEVLLACCNYAFDVAQANGAAEVGLEHLVNALTRVENAARTLESRGVREGQLRRESAALIASELPASNAGDAISPRRAADFEDVLRHASDVGHRRGSPATVDDVLQVLLHYGRDLPVVQLLRRLTPDWQRLEWPRLREQPPLAEPSPRAVAVQLVANDGVPARVAGIEDGIRLMQSEFAAERKLLMDLIRDVQRDLVAQRGDGVAFRGDLGQRLESLERSLSHRSDGRNNGLLADRLARFEETLQGSLAETLRGTRELAQRLGQIETVVADAKTAPALPPALVERIGALEAAVQNGMGEGARIWAGLGQRLTRIETSLGETRDPAGLEAIGERIASLERVIETNLAEGARTFGQLGQRLSAFEGNVGGADATELVQALQPRLDAIERQLDQSGVVTRLERVVGLVESDHREASRIHADLTERLSTIEAYVVDGASSGTSSSPADSADLRELTDRLGGLERAVRTGFGDAAAAMGQIVQRLVTVERGVVERPYESDSMLILEDRIGALDSRGQQALTTTGEIAQRLRTLEARIEERSQLTLAATRDIAERLGAMEQRAPLEGGAPGTASFLALADTDMARIDAVQAAVTAVAARIDQLDERMRSDSVVTEEALRGRDQDFDFIYNEIKEVAQSQATLNSAVSDWRSESQEQFSALANRLEKLLIPRPAEPSLVRAPTPVPSPEPPPGARPRDSADIIMIGAPKPDQPKATTVRADDYALPPQQPGKGFWYWLFGTSSLSAANRENDLDIGRMRDNIRETRERRRTEV